LFGQNKFDNGAGTYSGTDFEGNSVLHSDNNVYSITFIGNHNIFYGQSISDGSLTIPIFEVNPGCGNAFVQRNIVSHNILYFGIRFYD
jgi:hypothetical protein